MVGLIPKNYNCSIITNFLYNLYEFVTSKVVNKAVIYPNMEEKRIIANTRILNITPITIDPIKEYSIPSTPKNRVRPQSDLKNTTNSIQKRNIDKQSATTLDDKKYEMIARDWLS